MSRIDRPHRCAGRVFAIAVMMGAGCSGDLADPPGKAPTLAGSWRLSTTSDNSGCLIVDETGDLTTIRNTGANQTPFGVQDIEVDGKWRPLDLGNTPADFPNDITIEYATVGEVTLTDSTARLQFTMTVRIFGISVATATATIEGIYDGTSIVGTARSTFVSHVPGLPPPPEPEITEVTYVRSDC